MITSPFPPSTRDLIDGIRRENPTLTEAQAAYRLIGEKDAKILDLTAQLNETRFRERLLRYLLRGVLIVVGVSALAVLWWVKR